MAANGPGSYLNKAVGMGFDAEPTDEDVARVERFFAARGIEPKVELTQFAPAPFLRKLAEHGFVLQEFENTLVIPLRGLGDPRALLPGGWPEGVRIERVDPRDDPQVDALRPDQRQRIHPRRRGDLRGVPPHRDPCGAIARA